MPKVPPKRSARRIVIADWDLDERSLDELAAHGVTVEILEQVVREQPRFRRNKRRRAATHQMIGPDEGGRIWVVCLVETGPAMWRPVTGWPAGDHEIAWWRRSV